MAAGGIALKLDVVPSKDSLKRGGDLVNKDCTAHAIIAHSTSGVARKGHVIHVKPLGAVDPDSAAVALLGGIVGKYTIFKAGRNTIDTDCTRTGRVYSLVAGKRGAHDFQTQVIALGAAVNIQSAARAPVCGVLGKGVAVDVNRCVNAVGVITKAIGTHANRTADAVRAVVGKGVAFVRVRGTVLPQGTQCKSTATVIGRVVRSNGTTVLGTVVPGEHVVRKVRPGIACHPHSTAAAPAAGACRGSTVSVKGAVVNVQINAGIATVSLPPGGDSAAIAGGGVAGKGAVLHVQAGHLHSVGRVSGVDLNQNRAASGIVAIFHIIGGRVPVKSAAFHCVNRVELGSFAVGVGVVHCARVAQGRVARKGTVFQRVFLDIAVKGNRAAAQGRIVAVQGGFSLGIFLLGGGGLGRAEGHVLDGVVRQAVKGGVKGQRAAVGIGAVIGKGAAVERNRHLHQDVIRLDMQGVLVGQVQRTAVLGGMVARKGHAIANGGLYTGAQVDRTAKAARVVGGKVGIFQREPGCVMHVQGRAVAVGFAVGDGGAALHGKAGVHAVAVFTLELFELIGVVRVLQRFLIFAQSNIELAVGIHGGGAFHVHTRAGTCVGKAADGRAIQREGAAQLYLHAAGGSAAVGRLDGAAVDGEIAKHRYADSRIGGHCQRGVGHI